MKFLAAGLLSLACGTAGAEVPPTPGEMARQVGFDQRLGERMPLDARFKDETGREVRLGDFFGKRPVILTLVYFECPMLCNQTLNGLVRSLRGLSLTWGKDFDVISISIDPEETPRLARAKKDSYASEIKGGQNWHFLTGNSAAVQAVADQAGFRYARIPGSKEFAHASGLVVLTPEGVIARYLFGVDFAPKDLKLALVESSGGRIGTAVDQFLLLCYHYNPMTGKYGLAISGALKAGGLATLACLGGFIGLSLLRERQKAHAP